ncbi:MAG: hypothetical protein RBR65_07755 [Aliarcobacter sp.]|jgi:Spy/CpxP family protein refolding chaperone|nr:hypothetical protein [Aliarcobacter sp.]
MKILRIFLLLSSLFLFVNADDDDHKYKHSYKNLEYLELNSSQLEKMKDILIDFKHKYKDFYEYKDDKEDILEDIMEDKNFDEKLYFETLIDLKTRAAKLEVEKMSKIHKILDEKQREKFADYLEEWEVE